MTMEGRALSRPRLQQQRPLAGSGSILHPRIAQGEDFLDSLLDEVVRATGSDGDPHRKGRQLFSKRVM